MDEDWEKQFQTIVSNVELDPSAEPIKGWEARQIILSMNEIGMWLGKISNDVHPDEYTDLPEETWVVLKDLIIRLDSTAELLCDAVFEEDDFDDEEDDD